MTTDAGLVLAHHHPGRLRLRSDALRHAEVDGEAGERVARVRAALDAVGGVHGVHHNERSGSVRVDYEPGAVDPNAIIELVARAAGLAPPSPAEDALRDRARPAVAAISAARDLNAIAHDLTGGRADLRDLVPMAMTGLAAYSYFVKKDPLPRWDNLAYWAFSLFQSFHKSEIEALREPGR